MIVVEDQKERTARPEVCEERLDATLERRLVDLLARTKRIVLRVAFTGDVRRGSRNERTRL